MYTWLNFLKLSASIWEQMMSTLHCQVEDEQSQTSLLEQREDWKRLKFWRAGQGDGSAGKMDKVMHF